MAYRNTAAQTASESLEVADRVGRSKTQTHAPLTSTRRCWTLRCPSDRVSLGGLGVLRLFRTAMQLLSTLKDEKIDHLGDVLRGALCGMGA